MAGPTRKLTAAEVAEATGRSVADVERESKQRRQETLDRHRQVSEAYAKPPQEQTAMDRVRGAAQDAFKQAAAPPSKDNSLGSALERAGTNDSEWNRRQERLLAEVEEKSGLRPPSPPASAPSGP